MQSIVWFESSTHVNLKFKNLNFFFLRGGAEGVGLKFQQLN